MKVLGIDPGLGSGAAAVYDTARPTEISLIDLPIMGVDTRQLIDVVALSRWIAKIMPWGESAKHFAYIEFVTAMNSWGSVQSFRLGMAFGQLRSTVQLCGLNYTLVTPVTWKKHFDLLIAVTDEERAAREPTTGMTKDQITDRKRIADAANRRRGIAGKTKSRDCAAKLFPGQASLFFMAKHDGRAEAALIARYGAETMGGLALG